VATTDALTPILSALARLPADRFSDQARLGDLGIGSSIVIGMLDARLRDQLGSAPDRMSWKTTVGDLRKHFAGSLTTPAPPAAPPVSALPSAAAGFAIGLDLEDISTMPPMGDPFYAAHFTDGELARAKDKEDAVRHLCGVWCVKEAAKKACPPLVPVPATALEVTMDDRGRPSLRVLGQVAGGALPRFEISITHASAVAAAVVVALPGL
jgi:phosphopantetheine--protein transferase-like protein